MKFIHKNLIITELNMFEFKILKKHDLNKNRGYDALTYRYSGRTIIEYNNKKIYTNPGELVYIPKYKDYYHTCLDDDPIILAAHFQTKDDYDTDFETFEPEDSEPYRILFQKMIKEYDDHNFGYRFSCMSIFYKVLNMIDMQKNNIDNDIRKITIYESVLYMRNNFHNSSLKISDLASLAGLSEGYYRRIFNSIYGIPPHKYLHKLRMNRAVDLLLSGYYYVSEIAEMTGFNDANHFSNEFKKTTGFSPMNYIKNNI